MALYDIYTKHTAKTLFPNRADLIRGLKREKCYDLVVVGAGLMGVTVAHLAAFNGFKTLLLEKGDLGERQATHDFLLGQPSLFRIRRDLQTAKALENTAIHIVKPVTINSRLDFLHLISNKLAKRIVKKSGDDVELLEYEYSPLSLTLERALAATQEGATVFNYAEVTSIFSSPAGLRQVSWTDVLTGRHINTQSKAVAICAGEDWNSVARVTHLDSSDEINSEYFWHEEHNVFRLQGGSALHSVRIAEDLMSNFSPKNTKHFTSVVDRKLPGSANFNLNTSEFYKAAVAASVPVAIIENCINRLGGRVSMLVEIEDGLKVIDNKLLYGELILAIQQDKAVKLEDLLERRLFLKKEECSPQVCKIAKECLNEFLKEGAII